MKIKFYFFHHIESKFFYLTGGQKEPSQKGPSKKGPKIESKGTKPRDYISKTLLNLTT